MQWALLAVIIIGLFLVSGRYPKVAFSILGALVFAAAAFVLWSSDKTALKRQKLPVSVISVENTTVVPAYADSYRVAGRIVNDHESVAMKEATLKVEMLDCKSDDTDSCQIVGQTIERVTLAIPAGQARDFSTTVHFGTPRISGTIDWRFSITATRS